MCVFQCGRNLEKAVPSLVIMVHPGVAYDWYKLAPILRALFTDYVEIEFLPGGATFLTGTEDDDDDDEDAFKLNTPPFSELEDELGSPPKGGIDLVVKPYPQHPAMGASIGISDQIGVFVKGVTHDSRGVYPDQGQDSLQAYPRPAIRSQGHAGGRLAHRRLVLREDALTRSSPNQHTRRFSRLDTETGGGEGFYQPDV